MVVTHGASDNYILITSALGAYIELSYLATVTRMLSRYSEEVALWDFLKLGSKGPFLRLFHINKKKYNYYNKSSTGMEPIYRLFIIAKKWHSTQNIEWFGHILNHMLPINLLNIARHCDGRQLCARMLCYSEFNDVEGR